MLYYIILFAIQVFLNKYTLLLLLTMAKKGAKCEEFSLITMILGMVAGGAISYFMRPGIDQLASYIMGKH